MESQDICPYSPNISSCQTLNEENIRNQDYDLAVENKNEIQSSHGQSLTREQGKEREISQWSIPPQKVITKLHEFLTKIKSQVLRNLFPFFRKRKKKSIMGDFFPLDAAVANR